VPAKLVAGTTFVPSLNTKALAPAGTATPVPVSVLNRDRISKVVLDQVELFNLAPRAKDRLRAPPDVPVQTSLRLRAVWVPLVFESVRVTSALENETSAEPVIASSKAVPKFVLVVAPQVPTCSPVPISSILRSE
jgi:hypothetical protein